MPTASSDDAPPARSFQGRGYFARRLTALRAPLSPSAGHAVPTRRVLSARRVEMTDHRPEGAGEAARREKPEIRPARPYFSSGPCAKPPGWAPEKLATGSLGRSHRSKLGKARLGHAIELMRNLLRIPDTHRIGIVPGSDTGAFEMAMWTMLGA